MIVINQEERDRILSLSLNASLITDAYEQQYLILDGCEMLIMNELQEIGFIAERQKALQEKNDG